MQNYFHKRLDFVVFLSYIKYAVQLGSIGHHIGAIQNIRTKVYISQALSHLCDIRHTISLPPIKNTPWVLNSLESRY